MKEFVAVELVVEELLMMTVVEEELALNGLVVVELVLKCLVVLNHSAVLYSVVMKRLTVLVDKDSILDDSIIDGCMD